MYIDVLLLRPWSARTIIKGREAFTRSFVCGVLREVRLLLRLFGSLLAWRVELVCRFSSERVYWSKKECLLRYTVLKTQHFCICIYRCVPVGCWLSRSRGSPGLDVRPTETSTPVLSHRKLIGLAWNPRTNRRPQLSLKRWKCSGGWHWVGEGGSATSSRGGRNRWLINVVG